jgi:hypothetical protein
MKEFRFTVSRQDEGAIHPTSLEDVLKYFLSEDHAPEVEVTALGDGGISVVFYVFEPDVGTFAELIDTALANGVYADEANPALTTSSEWARPKPPWQTASDADEKRGGDTLAAASVPGPLNCGRCTAPPPSGGRPGEVGTRREHL